MNSEGPGPQKKKILWMGNNQKILRRDKELKNQKSILNFATTRNENNREAQNDVRNR